MVPCAKHAASQVKGRKRLVAFGDVRIARNTSRTVSTPIAPRATAEPKRVAATCASKQQLQKSRRSCGEPWEKLSKEHLATKRLASDIVVEGKMPARYM